MKTPINTEIGAGSQQCRALLDRVVSFAKQRGVKPQTVVHWATGNVYLFDRLQRRADTLSADLAKIDAYLTDHKEDQNGKRTENA